MMTDGTQEEGTRPDEERADALWRLLERGARPRPVSPYFARRVLREVSALGETRPAAARMSSWLTAIWGAALGAPAVAIPCALGVVCLLVGGGMGLSWTRRPVPVDAVALSSVETPTTNVVSVGPAVLPDGAAEPLPSVAMSTEPVVTAQDVEVIADLDNLLSHEESRLWTEDETARF